MASKKRVGSNISIEGMDEIIKNFKRIASTVDEKDMENNLLEAAMVIRDDAKARAPLGKTGKLRDSIVAKRFNNPTKGKPGAFVAIDYRIAPYAHLVEYGHGGSNPAPAHEFFRPAMDNNIATVKRMIESGILEIIEKAAKR